jgi:PAS domain S-box-containing protein
MLCYLGASLGGALIIRPQMVSPLWLGNVLLASILLLVPRRTWAAVLAAGLAGFLIFDLQAGGPIRSVAWLLLSNAAEVLTAALCLSYSFGGVPRLNSVKALVKYSFYAVLLAPFVGAFLGALSTRSNYWASWKVAFFSEAIGFLTLMPAILGWTREIPVWAQKPRAFYLEAITLLVALVILGQLAFGAPERSSPPALLYSLVPLLLWATLRFGSTGVSTSMIAIAFLSIWGAVHGEGPFTGPGPGSTIDVLSLQLFLFFMAAPFMALAVLAEERKDAEQALRQRDIALNEAQRLAQLGSWQWDPISDLVTWSAELYRLSGYDPERPSPSFKDHEQFFPPESWELLKQSVEKALRTGMPYEMDLEAIRKDGTKIWVTTRGEAVVDADGSPIYLRGTTQDITERKRAEAALFSVSGRLISAQEEERIRIASELHDDLSQRMALLAIGLEQFEQEMPDFSNEAREKLRQIAEIGKEVSSEIHNLSHQLHSRKLDTLGLVGAAGGFCKEFSTKYDLEIEFVHKDVQAQLPKDVTLCFFRILQEAVRNVMKHSRATRARVELYGRPDSIELSISDTGVGFDPEIETERAGIGLIIMRERLRLVGGDLVLESKPMQGTRIRARVPLSSTVERDGIEQELDEASTTGKIPPVIQG